MRTIYLFVLILLLVLGAANAQTIFRVNNNPAADADYATLQEAHDAAMPGDIIYMEPSGTAYAGATIAKKLTIIGQGYFLAENDTLADRRTVTIINDLIVNSGAEGTIISGLNLEGAKFTIKANNVIIKRNRIVGSAWFPYSAIIISGNNVIVQQCYIVHDISTAGENVLIINNYLQNGVTTNTTKGSTLIANNVIDEWIDIKNSYVYNNIFIRNLDSYLIDRGSNSLEYNIFRSSDPGIPTGNGNIQNIPFYSTMFVGGTSPDGQYRLTPTTQARGKGKDGTDPGMYGGVEPYIISGIPPVPTIYDATIPVTGSKQNGLPVKIKIHSNN